MTEEQIAEEQKVIAAEDKKRFDAKIESVVSARKSELDESHRQEWLDAIRGAMQGADGTTKSAVKEKLNGKRLSDTGLPIGTIKAIYEMVVE